MENAQRIGIIITSTGWGGLEMNTLKLAQLLVEKGYHLTLYTQENSTIYDKGKAIFQEVEIIRKNRKYFDFRSAQKMGKSLKSKDISSVLVVDNKDLDVVVWTKKRYHKNLKIVYQQHMQIGINKKDWLHTLRFKEIDVWVSPLPFLKREIAIRTHFPLSRVKVLPIGLDTDTFANRKYPQDEAKKALGVSLDVPLVGIIGRISKKKGQLFLVESLLKMKREGQNFQVLIFGSATVNDKADRAYAELLMNFVQENQLGNLVHFAEYQPDTAKFYNAIDVFVLASHSETYGMVTIEAMLNALPILATNSGGTTEILGEGQFGTLYTYEDHEDFSKKLKDILDNPQDFKAKGELAKECALKLYDQAAEVEGFIQIFKEL